MDHRSASGMKLAIATSLGLTSLVLMFSTPARAEGDSSSAVWIAAKQIAGLIDHLGDTGSVNEVELWAAWRAHFEAGAQLPPEVWGFPGSSGEPLKGLTACYHMLVNAESYARMQERQRARVHEQTQAAVQCYARVLTGAEACSGLAPDGPASSRRVQASRSLVAQYAPQPSSKGCYQLQPGIYQSYQRGYDGVTLAPTRKVTIFLVAGRYMLYTSDGTYSLSQAALVENGAQYVVRSVRLPKQDYWQPLRAPVYIRVVREANVDGAVVKYDAYFSNDPSMKTLLLSETWAYEKPER